MFDNVGKKIKLLSIVYSVVFDLICCILCVFFWNVIGATLGVIIIALGIIQSSVVSMLIYGFGKLIENSENQVKLLRISAELSLADHPNYSRFDEYAREIIEIGKDN